MLARRRIHVGQPFAALAQRDAKLSRQLRCELMQRVAPRPVTAALRLGGPEALRDEPSETQAATT